MMLKVVVVALASSGVFMLDFCGPINVNPPKKLKEGLVKSSATENYTLLAIKIDISKATKFKKYYDVLDMAGDIVPKLFGTVYDEDNSKCYVYFKNVYSINIRTYSDTASILKTYKKMIDALKANKLLSHFTLTGDAFRYNPITQQFLFVEIENLITYSPVEGYQIDHTSKYNLIDWVNNCDVFIMKNDNFKEFLGDIIPSKLPYFEEYRERYGIDTYEEKIEVKNRFEFGNDGNSSLILQISIQIDSKVFTIFQSFSDSDQKSYQFIKENTAFLIFLCEKMKGDITQCMNLADQSSPYDLLWEFKIKRDQRIDIEVQDAIERDEDHLIARRFYKIYLIVTPKNTPGVVPDDTNFYSKSNRIDIDNSFVLCETNHRDLRVLTSSKDNFTFKSTRITNGKVLNYSDLNIIQVLPSQIEMQSQSCKGLNKKIFILNKKAHTQNEILVMNKESENASVFLSLDKKPSGINQMTISSCNKSVNIPDFYYFVDQESFQTKDNKSHSYPSNLLLLGNRYQEDVLKDICVDYGKAGAQLFINYELEDIKSIKHKKINFYPNFNSHYLGKIYLKRGFGASESKNNVYLSDNPHVIFYDFKYRDFRFPEVLSRNIFLSIEKTQEGYFQVRAILFNIDNTIREIPTYFNKYLTFTVMPFKIEYLSKDSSNQYTVNELFLINLMLVILVRLKLYTQSTSSCLIQST